MKQLKAELRILLIVALIHCLLTFVLRPMGWEYLYQWDSPHWLRAIWASLFDLPILIVFAGLAYSSMGFLFLFLIPLNSLIFSWLLVPPALHIVKFRRTRERHDLTSGLIRLVVAVAVFCIIGMAWIPPNIISQKEAGMMIRQRFDALMNETPNQAPEDTARKLADPQH